MNFLFIKNYFVGFMVSEIPRVSVFGHSQYSITFPYINNNYILYKFSQVKIIYYIILRLATLQYLSY